MPEEERALPLSVAVSVSNLSAGYDSKRIVDDVTMTAGLGEVVAIIGHNGAGKSTLLRCIFGLIPAWNGEIRVFGELIKYSSPRLSLSLGLSYIPQGNRVFRDLSVFGNLEVSAQVIAGKKTRLRRIDEVLEKFPTLRERTRQKACTLSGGEKQLLALANALMVVPRVLLADEPSLGLAPRAAESVLILLKSLADSGMTVMLVEQRVRAALGVADRVYVLRRGRTTFAGESSALRDENILRQVYL